MRCIQEVETTPVYPDICFAVDDFDSTFDAVVICLSILCNDRRSWYMVLLASYVFVLLIVHLKLYQLES